MPSVRWLSTSRGRFLIRPYLPGDEQKILSSWRVAFGKELSLADWRWKYPGNPYGFRCLLCFSEDGVVVAHYAAQVVRIAFAGDHLWGLHLTDSFSHPAYRWALGGKTGLFVRTGWLFLKTFLEDIPLPLEDRLDVEAPPARFHYGFPGERHYRLGVKLMRYRLHRPGILYLQASTGKPSSSWKLLPYTTEVCPLSEFEGWELLDRLWQRVEKYSPFCVVRDTPYLRWRFEERPLKKYFIFYAKKYLRKEIKAWIIFDIEAEKIRLLDFLAEEAGLLEVLLRKFLKWVAASFPARRRLEIWLAGNHPLKGAFLAAGFVPACEPLGIIPNTRFDSLEISPDRADEFFFTMADADLF